MRLTLVLLLICSQLTAQTNVKHNGSYVVYNKQRVYYPPVEDFFFSFGQSNMGYDSIQNLPPDTLSKYAGLIEGCKIFMPRREAIQGTYDNIWNYNWEPLNVGENTSFTLPHCFGAEASFCYNYYKTYRRKTRFYKLGVEGTSLYNCWIGGSCWTYFINSIDSCYKKASQEGILLNLKGFIYNQGESDGTVGHPYDTLYAENLAKLVHRTDSVILSKCTKYGQPYNTTYKRYIIKMNPYYSVIVGEQQVYVATDPRAKLISWDSCNRPSIHYSAIGLICGGWQIFLNL